MVEKLKLIVLVDNEPGEGFRNSWGFSAYIESESFKILFDADTEPNVLEYNVEKIGLDLRKLDFAVLSHHHSDHYGGFKYVGEIAKELNIYVPPGDVDYLRRWGLNPIINRQSRKVLEDVWLIGPLKSGVWGIYEEALAIKVDESLLLLVGCSHPGVDNLAFEAFEKTGMKIYWVLGGYHGPSHKTLDRLASISQYISPAHCSGNEAKKYIRENYPGKYIHVYTGLAKNIPF